MATKKTSLKKTLTRSARSRTRNTELEAQLLTAQDALHNLRLELQEERTAHDRTQGRFDEMMATYKTALEDMQRKLDEKGVEHRRYLEALEEGVTLVVKALARGLTR